MYVCMLVINPLFNWLYVFYCCLNWIYTPKENLSCSFPQQWYFQRFLFSSCQKQIDNVSTEQNALIDIEENIDKSYTYCQFVFIQLSNSSKNNTSKEMKMSLSSLYGRELRCYQYLNVNKSSVPCHEKSFFFCTTWK